LPDNTIFKKRFKIKLVLKHVAHKMNTWQFIIVNFSTQFLFSTYFVYK